MREGERREELTSLNLKGFGPAIVESRTLALNGTLGTVCPSLTVQHDLLTERERRVRRVANITNKNDPHINSALVEIGCCVGFCVSICADSKSNTCDALRGTITLPESTTIERLGERSLSGSSMKGSPSRVHEIHRWPPARHSQSHPIFL
jgi:hypothetical protein